MVEGGPRLRSYTVNNRQLTGKKVSLQRSGDTSRSVTGFESTQILFLILGLCAPFLRGLPALPGAFSSCHTP